MCVSTLGMYRAPSPLPPTVWEHTVLASSEGRGHVYFLVVQPEALELMGSVLCVKARELMQKNT